MAEIALSDAGAHTRRNTYSPAITRRPAAMAVPEGHGVQGWFLRAVVHGLTGLVFGLIVALVLVLLSDTGPMKWLARQGSDFGMRLYAWHSALLGVKLRAQGASFAFIDVNREACAKWIGATPAGPKTAEELPGECN